MFYFDNRLDSSHICTLKNCAKHIILFSQSLDTKYMNLNTIQHIQKQFVALRYCVYANENSFRYQTHNESSICVSI